MRKVPSQGGEDISRRRSISMGTRRRRGRAAVTWGPGREHTQREQQGHRPWGGSVLQEQKDTITAGVGWARGAGYEEGNARGLGHGRSLSSVLSARRSHRRSLSWGVIQSGLSLPKITLGLGVWRMGRSKENRSRAASRQEMVGPWTRMEGRRGWVIHWILDTLEGGAIRWGAEWMWGVRKGKGPCGSLAWAT